MKRTSFIVKQNACHAELAGNFVHFGRRIATRLRSAARAAHPLQRVGHRRWGVNLDHPVQVAHVDTQLQRARGDDDVVFPRGKCLFGLPALLVAERTVGHERRHFQLPKLGAQLLGRGAAVDKHQPFLAAVEARDHNRGVLERSDIVELDFGRTGARRQMGTSLPVAGRRQLVDQGVRVADHR